MKTFKDLREELIEALPVSNKEKVRKQKKEKSVKGNVAKAAVVEKIVYRSRPKLRLDKKGKKAAI